MEFYWVNTGGVGDLSIGVQTEGWGNLTNYSDA